MTEPRVKIGPRSLVIDDRDVSSLVSGYTLAYEPDTGYGAGGIPQIIITLVPGMPFAYDGPAEVSVIEQPIGSCPQCDHCRGAKVQRP